MAAIAYSPVGVKKDVTNYAGTGTVQLVIGELGQTVQAIADPQGIPVLAAPFGQTVRVTAG